MLLYKKAVKVRKKFVSSNVAETLQFEDLGV